MLNESNFGLLMEWASFDLKDGPLQTGGDMSIMVGILEVLQDLEIDRFTLGHKFTQRIVAPIHIPELRIILVPAPADFAALSEMDRTRIQSYVKKQGLGFRVAAVTDRYNPSSSYHGRSTWIALNHLPRSLRNRQRNIKRTSE